MYGCECWTINNWRIDAFELWCWRILLRVPWTAGRSNQSILKEIIPEYSLEGLRLKLKLQYFGHLMWRTDYWKRLCCWERLKVGGKGNNRGWGAWMASPTQWAWVWVSSGSWWQTGKPGVLHSMVSQIVRHDWVTELNWTRKGSCLTWRSLKLCLVMKGILMVVDPDHLHTSHHNWKVLITPLTP